MRSDYSYYYRSSSENCKDKSRGIEEIELEKLKQQNFIIETEKMKLELEQMKLDYSSGNNDVFKR